MKDYSQIQLAYCILYMVLEFLTLHISVVRNVVGQKFRDENMLRKLVRLVSCLLVKFQERTVHLMFGQTYSIHHRILHIQTLVNELVDSTVVP